jgi:hypothetical protein
VLVVADKHSRCCRGSSSFTYSSSSSHSVATFTTLEYPRRSVWVVLNVQQRTQSQGACACGNVCEHVHTHVASGASSALELLDSYGLSRDDVLDGMTDMVLFKEEVPVIDGKAKAAFTRLYARTVAVTTHHVPLTVGSAQPALPLFTNRICA